MLEPNTEEFVEGDLVVYWPPEDLPHHKTQTNMERGKVYKVGWATRNIFDDKLRYYLEGYEQSVILHGSQTHLELYKLEILMKLKA